MAAFVALAALAGCDDGDEDGAVRQAVDTPADDALQQEDDLGDDGAVDALQDRDRAPGAVDIPAVFREVQPAVVAVITGGGEGSGVVYDDEGTVVTNAHVVGDADTVRLLYADGETAEAEVVGTDPLLDLAVLRSERQDIPAAEFSDELPQIGEPAIAIGNPLGFENTVTAGIVSGLERSIPGGAPSLVGLIQTDAAISPGNSGGALVNAAGEVIGINVAYVPPQAGAVSLGFAIPSPLATDAINELLTEGSVDHAFLGVQPHTLTPEIARRFDVDAESGVVVITVEPGSPAAEAGIEQGDVITELAGDRIETVEDLFAAVRRLDGGDTVPVRLVTESGAETVEVTVASRPVR